jgi:hypothetical protein
VKFEAAFRVTGTITNYVTRRPVAFQLRTGRDDVSTVRASVNTESGRFQLGLPIVPGAYVLRATQDQTVAEMPFVVRGGDLSNVALTLSPLLDVPVVSRFTGMPPGGDDVTTGQRGRFAPPGCFASLQPVGVLVQAESAATMAASAIKSRGESVVRGLAPGSYRVTATCPGGYPRSVVSGTHDLAADPILNLEAGATPPPIEILAVYGGGRIQGRVAGGQSRNPNGVTVVLVPRFGSAAGPQTSFAFQQPGAELSQFFFAGLAPGSYTMYAFAQRDIEFRNPEFLQSLPGGTTVEIEADGQKEVTLDVVIP